jgi:hypothetical protein
MNDQKNINTDCKDYEHKEAASDIDSLQASYQDKQIVTYNERLQQ